MLTIALHNRFTAREEVLTQNLGRIALNHHRVIAPLEDLERWLSRRSQVLHLQIGLLEQALDDGADTWQARYDAGLAALQCEMVGRFQELMDARVAGGNAVHVVAEDGRRMVPLDGAERERRLARFSARLDEEMGAHRCMRVDAPGGRAGLLDDLRQEWRTVEDLLSELKERMELLNLPAVEAAADTGSELRQLRLDRADASRHAAHHQHWLLACMRGDLPSVVAILEATPAAERAAFIDRAGPDGLGGWHIACEQHDFVMASLLAGYGADLHQPTESGRPPLFLAVRRDHGERTACFLDWLQLHGLSPLEVDLAGRNALNEAAYHGNVPAMQWLRDYGLSLSEPDRHGRAPLHVAAAAGHGAAVGWLLQNGADVHARNSADERPILEAARHGRASAILAFAEAGYCLDATELDALRGAGMLGSAEIRNACTAPLRAMLKRIEGE